MKMHEVSNEKLIYSAHEIRTDAKTLIMIIN
jgi:hypothetical protein